MPKRSRSERIQDAFKAAHRARDKAHREGDAAALDEAKERERTALQQQRDLSKDAKWTKALAAASWRGARGAQGPRGERGEPGATGARGARGERGEPGVTPEGLAALVDTVRQLRIDSEIQLRRIADLQAQLDIALGEFHRRSPSARRKRPPHTQPE